MICFTEKMGYSMKIYEKNSFLICKYADIFSNFHCICDMKATPIILFFLLPWAVWGRFKDPVDSLKHLLASTSADTMKVKILSQISYRLSGDKPEESMKYAIQALDIAEKSNYPRGISKAYNNLGIIARVQGDYLKALEYFFKALEIDENLGDDKETAKTMSGIGAVFVKMKDYDKGIEFFEKALALRYRLKDSLGVAICYTNLGDIYQKKREYHRAITYHQKSLEIEQKVNPVGIHYSLHSLGNIYYEIGSVDEAIKFYQEALQMRKNLNNKFIIAETDLELAKALAQKGRYTEAYAYLDEGLALAKLNKAKELEAKAYQYFAEYYEKQNLLPQVFAMQKKYLQINDSLYNVEVSRQANLTLTKFQNNIIEKQQRENAWLKKSKEAQDKYASTQKNISLSAVINGTITLLLAAFLLLSLRKNQRIAQELALKKSEIESQHHQLILQHQELANAKHQIEAKNVELHTFNQKLEKLIEERTEKIRIASDALRTAKEELELFMYRISHDFRGPLATLSGIAMLGKLENEDNKVIDLFEKTERITQKMGKMLDKLVMVNVISHRTPEFERVSFKQMVENILPSVSNGFSNANIQMFFAEEYLLADKELLRIILLNLLENAFEFHKPGNQHEHSVIVSLDLQKDCVKISVEDNGIGIPKERQKEMFNMFVRSSETSQGNGLGLYIVKKAVERLKGKISVESIENEYTRICVFIPNKETLA
jgi:signal transduction histidine kinase